YNPSFGRWVSRDPISETAEPNLYGFVRNQPQNTIDLLGLAAFPPVMDHTTFYRSWNESQRAEWFHSFRQALGAAINKSAAQHCVPKRLLAAVVANEMIDWDKLD